MFNARLKQAYASVQQELQQQQAVMAALERSTAIIRFDRDGKVLSANRNFLTTLGYGSEAELLGKPHSLFCVREDIANPDYQRFWERLRRGEYFSGRVKRQTATGQVIWLEATYNPVLDSHGAVQSYMQVCHRHYRTSQCRSHSSGQAQRHQSGDGGDRIHPRRTDSGSQ